MLVGSSETRSATDGAREISSPTNVGAADTLSFPVELVVGVDEKGIIVGTDEVSSPPVTVGDAETFPPPGGVVVGDSVKGAPKIGAADGEVEFPKISSSSAGAIVGTSDTLVKMGTTLGGCTDDGDGEEVPGAEVSVGVADASLGIVGASVDVAGAGEDIGATVGVVGVDIGATVGVDIGATVGMVGRTVNNGANEGTMSIGANEGEAPGALSIGA